MSRFCTVLSFPSCWLWPALLALLVGGCGEGDGPGVGQSGMAPVVAVGSQWYGHIPV